MEKPMNVLRNLLASRKVWISLAALIASVVTALGGVVSEEFVTTVIMAIVTVSSVLVGAISHEDAATKRATLRISDTPTQAVPNGPPTIGGFITREEAANREVRHV
jgi:hypothetical protein